MKSHTLVLAEYRRFMSRGQREQSREDASFLLLDHLQELDVESGLLEYNNNYEKWRLHIASLKEQHGAQGKYLTALLDFVGPNQR